MSALPDWFVRWAAMKAKGKSADWAAAEFERRRESRRGGDSAARAMPMGVTEGQQRLLARHGLTATTFAEAASLIAQATSERRKAS